MSDQERFLAIAAPRGHAKSTGFTFLKPMKGVAYRLNKFILIVSDTYEQACLFLEDVINEFEKNTTFTRFYNLEITKKRDDRIVINDECMIRAMGAGQKFRGLKFRHYRPDLIICDDIENDEMVENPKRREKLRKWFWGALKPMLSDKGRLVVIGTILHEDSLLANLLNDPLFFSKLYQIIGDDYKPLWPALYSLEDIAEMRNNFEKRNQLGTFYREFFNACVSPENKKFDLAWLKYFNLKDIERPGMLESWFRMIHVDLAHDDEKGEEDNAYNALVATAYDADTDRRYFLEVARFKEEFDEIVKKLFEMVDFWKPHAVSVETVGAQKHLYQHIRSEMRIRGKRFVLLPLPHTRAKDPRILIMQYPMQIGKYYFRRGHMNEFEKELAAFPRSTYKDVEDAASQIEECLDKLNLVKTPRKASGRKRTSQKKMKTYRRGARRITGGRHGCTGY